MSGWSDSPRTPSGVRTGNRAWRQLRAQALDRDNHECQLRGPRCTGHAVQVDHVMPAHRGGTDDVENLVSVCRSCHAAKSQREATVARNRWKRQPEPHPGLIY